jgi:hypothetical protein
MQPKTGCVRNLNSHHLGDKEYEMSEKAILMMPAIYRFDFLKKSWGWHRAFELIEAIDNIRLAQGKEKLGTVGLLKMCPFINPHTTRNNGCYHIVTAAGQLMIAQHGNGTNWLEDLVKENSYLPAQIGMRFIEAVKHPVRTGLRNLAN